MITYDLIQFIRKWNPTVLVVVVDDCTPLDDKNKDIVRKIKKLAAKDTNIKYLRTAQNALKAGALNFGIKYLQSLPKRPRVVFTLDDDVVLDKDTIPLLANALYSSKRTGAACSLVRVSNKAKNILTRLQALEYHSFNLTKIADNTLLQGPLVMQGMITGFRMSALRRVKGFTTGHLIEDYDITARLKKYGWRVKIAPSAAAWTTVPESISNLWKQRIRWTYGGLRVVMDNSRHFTVIFQDIIGHIMFLSLISLIILSFVLRKQGEMNSMYAMLLTIVALANLMISFGYNLMILSSFKDGDIRDWILKLSIIPEFIYSNILSLILLGSYLFFIYQHTFGVLATKFKTFSSPYTTGLNIFQKIGYSASWGTKEINKKGGI